MNELKSYLLLTATGAVLILAHEDLSKHTELVKNLSVGSLKKFLAYEVPLESVKKSYSAHYEHVLSDPKQGDDFVVIDDDGQQIFENISLKELGKPIVYEQG